MLTIKRAYEEVEEKDGYRILVDRIWPRGVSKGKLAIDLWDKEIAPTTELRKWFHHDPEKFEEFKNKYWQELEENFSLSEFIEGIKEQLKSKNVTLVYGAKDRIHNHAVILMEYLKRAEVY